MYENFLALPADKQQRIRDAAFQEFGHFGYKKTSMEQVAQRAEIAKGMVFHYFGSKLGLFEYLVKYAESCMDRWFSGLGDEVKTLDFIEQYRRATKVKLKAYTEQPHVFEFFAMLYMHPENLDVSEKVRAVYEGGMAARMVILATIQNSENTWLFREDFDKEKAKKYVTWLIDGYAQHLLTLLSARPLADLSIDGYWNEFDGILDDLKKLLYRSEGS